MTNNSYGKAFTISTFGESHGPGIGVVIDGCPAGLVLDLDKIRMEMLRRKPGQSRLTTQRKEEDTFQILSGVFEGTTTGTPLCIFIQNENQQPNVFRPSHADFTYQLKYGIRDYRGGGRSSARETASRVAAGAIAKQILETTGIRIQAYVQQIGLIKVEKSYQELNLDLTESNDVRCPDPEIAVQMEELIDTVSKDKDTIGGLVRCIITGTSPGLGEPVFDKLHAELGKAMLSINAVKGFQIGSGFSSLGKRGSEQNDEFFNENGRIRTRTNYSGGVQGGISNGEDIYFDVAFKPVATIMQNQTSVDSAGNLLIVEGKGRHDPCVLPRAVPIVEAMAALVVVDFWLRNRMTKL
jgi:chorismate synthase